MNILIIGQCTLHWGRMEFGNIGNYYIIEPLVRELHHNFPGAHIKTTFQMSERFCKDENIEVLPMSLYYGFDSADLQVAQHEYAIAQEYALKGAIKNYTPYIDAVLDSDLVIDFSGDIWGDNADFLGADRFLVGLLKDRTAQLLGKKTAMIAGSPGPFSPNKNLEFAKEVFKNFDLVTNRESISRAILEEYNFSLEKLVDSSCPAFLFEPKKNVDFKTIHPFLNSQRQHNVVGVVLCGWNFLNGPFDKWPRADEDYEFIVNPLMTLLDNQPDVKLCLMSHSNGFIPGKKPFELIHGRDYPITKQLQKILITKGYQDHIFVLDGVYDAWTTKAIISGFDMLISGRIHAAVSGLSQFVPTVVIDYGHEPKAHKLKGFAKEAGMEHFVANPESETDMLAKITECWRDREHVSSELKNNIPNVRQKSKMNFKLLKELFK